MVIEEARRQGFSVIATDLDTPRNRRHARRYGLETTTYWGDVRCVDFVAAISNVDAVIHLAAILPPVTERAPELAHAVNVGATARLMESLEIARSRAVLVYPSSVTVFGPPAERGRLYGIDDPTRATDNYSAHKLEIERRLAQSRINWVILRVGVAVDARRLGADAETLRTLFGIHADNPLEYVHPRDVASAMVNAVRSPQAQRKILLIGGGQRCRVTQHEFLAAGLDALGLGLPRDLLGQNSYYTCWMDTEESQALLNFQHHSFADYREEMRRKMRWPRRLLAPLRPAARWGMRRFLAR
jgi:nucleoside-diphosphate-sugar epimerase